MEQSYNQLRGAPGSGRSLSAWSASFGAGKDKEMKGGSSNRCQHTVAALQMQLKNPAMDYFITPSGDPSTV